MAILRELEVDLVLSGHRHVPYVWSISGVRVVTPGRSSTLRVRGTMPPSYNVIELNAEEVRIALREPGQGRSGRGAAAPLRPRGRHQQPVLPGIGALRALRAASVRPPGRAPDA